MSSSNKTYPLELSQFLGSDKPTYLNDYNVDMQKINKAVVALQTADENLSAAIAQKLTIPNGDDTYILNGKGVPIATSAIPKSGSTLPFTAGGAYDSVSRYKYLGEYRQGNRDKIYDFNEVITAKDALFFDFSAYNRSPFQGKTVMTPFGRSQSGDVNFGNNIILLESSHHSGVWSKRFWFITSSASIKLDDGGTDEFNEISVNIWLVKNWRGI